MYLDWGNPRLVRRMNTSSIQWIVFSIVAAAIILISTFAYYHRRPASADKPSIFSLARWRKRPQADVEAPAAPPMQQTASEPSNVGARVVARAVAAAASPTAEVDRRTSVRSVMTLPVYRQSASATEKVLGREGERDGIDVVVENPTTDEQEELRDEEMEALYQIRVLRRQQIAERDERRRMRHEARARGDHNVIEEIRQRRQNDESSMRIEGLRAEHERIKERRKRSASSVSYADVGVARLDGTRLRANSTESERCGLLSDSASMALSTRNSGESGHVRAPSIGSVFSADTAVESRSRAASTIGDTPRIGGMTPDASPRIGSVPDSRGRAGSSPEIVEVDLGDTLPPDYEDISLDDAARTSPPTPVPDGPPPEYPAPAQPVSSTDAGQTESSPLSSDDEGEGERAASNGGADENNTPTTPSRRQRLRLSVGGHIPQIVVQPSSADVEGRGRMW